MTLAWKYVELFNSLGVAAMALFSEAFLFSCFFFIFLLVPISLPFYEIETTLASATRT